MNQYVVSLEEEQGSLSYFVLLKHTCHSREASPSDMAHPSEDLGSWIRDSREAGKD